MARLPNVRLDISNRPENVLLVREALTGVAEAVGLDGGDLGDIRTAVTEACNNVVLHAYRGAEGPLEVEIEVEEGAIDVVVRDHGTGLDAPQAPSEPSIDSDAGIGMPVIEALSQEVRFDKTPEGGTEVHMRFSAPGVAALPATSTDSREPAADADGAPLPSPVRASISPPRLARTVVPRLLCVLAARAQFSTDRISDCQLLADALVASASRALSGSHLGLVAGLEGRDLEIRVAPLVAGHAERLLLDSVEGLGPVLGKLADGHGVRTTDSHDTLTLHLRERADAP